MIRLGGARTWVRGGLVTVAVGAILLSGGLEWLELPALNGQFRLRGPAAPRTPIVVVTIDEASFDELDLSWPWPRALHGQLLERLARGLPAAIGLDVLFVDPSARGPADDQALIEAVGRAGNVVLAAELTGVAESGFAKESLSLPIGGLRSRAAAVGVVNFPYDSDAFVREGLLGVTHQGAEIPSFDLQLYRLGARAGIPAAPLPPGRSFLIDFRGGPRTFPTVPFYRILRGEVPPEAFRGKIVLVGAASPSLHDLFPTPFAAQGMAGAEIHANALETLFQGTALVRIPRPGLLVLVLAAAVFAVWVTDRVRPLRALAAIVGAALAVAAAGFAAFAWGHLWVDQTAVPLALVLGYGATVVENFVQAQREKQRLARFFSPGVLREIVRHGSELGQSRRRVTVLFSDIRGFTPMAEKLTPEEVAALLREYMTSMSEAVFKHGGTVTQFAGDGIMALYNAPFDQPDHAAQAVRTALEFRERVKMLSDHWESKCGAPLRNGVGINTGEAVVGLVGSAQRVEYGAIGDTINLGSRLEGLTKEFPSPIIISDATYQGVRELFACRFLGEVTVKGKAIPVRIYGVEGEVRARAQRVGLKAPVMITETIGELQVSVPAQLADLSVSGLRVTDVPRPLALGQVVALRFELPGQPEPIATEGRVMWSTEGQAGLKFLELSAEDQRVVTAWLGRQGEATPSRA